MTEVYLVIEKYCLTEFDEKFEGSLVREVRTDKDIAKQRTKELKQIAMEEGDMSYLAEKLAGDYCEQLYWDSLRIVLTVR